MEILKTTTEITAARFTVHARRMVFFSRYEAAQWGSVCIEPHHLLLALLREAKPLFRLWSLDTPDAVRSLRAELATRFPLQIWTPRDTLPLSAAAKRVFEYAEEEAGHMGAWYIDSGHFLLGLLREEDAPAAAPVLHDRGLDIQEVRRRISGALSGAQPDSFQERQSRQALVNAL